MCSLLVHLGVYRYMAQTNQNKCLQFLLCAAIFFFFSLQSINREWNSIGGKLKQSKNYPSKLLVGSSMMMFDWDIERYIHLKWISSKNCNRQVIVDNSTLVLTTKNSRTARIEPDEMSCVEWQRIENKRCERFWLSSAFIHWPHDNHEMLWMTIRMCSAFKRVFALASASKTKRRNNSKL